MMLIIKGCRKYYACVDKEQKIFECEANEAWDNYLLTCLVNSLVSPDCSSEKIINQSNYIYD